MSFYDSKDVQPRTRRSCSSDLLVLVSETIIAAGQTDRLSSITTRLSWNALLEDRVDIFTPLSSIVEYPGMHGTVR
jgi:hypothetical protein